jgi:hypothetical protein
MTSGSVSDSASDGLAYAAGFLQSPQLLRRRIGRNGT